MLHVNVVVLEKWSFQKCGSKGDNQRKLNELPKKSRCWTGFLGVVWLKWLCIVFLYVTCTAFFEEVFQEGIVICLPLLKEPVFLLSVLSGSQVLPLNVIKMGRSFAFVPANCWGPACTLDCYRLLAKPVLYCDMRWPSIKALSPL